MIHDKRGGMLHRSLLSVVRDSPVPEEHMLCCCQQMIILIKESPTKNSCSFSVIHTTSLSTVYCQIPRSLLISLFGAKIPPSIFESKLGSKPEQIFFRYYYANFIGQLLTVKNKFFPQNYNSVGFPLLLSKIAEFFPIWQQVFTM